MFSATPAPTYSQNCGFVDVKCLVRVQSVLIQRQKTKPLCEMNRGVRLLVNGACQSSRTAADEFGARRPPRGLANWRGSIKPDPPGHCPSQNCVSTITKMRVVANERAGRAAVTQSTGRPAGRGAQQEMANKIYHLSDMIRKARLCADDCRLTLGHYAVIDSSIINANLNPVDRPLRLRSARRKPILTRTDDAHGWRIILSAICSFIIHK